MSDLKRNRERRRRRVRSERVLDAIVYANGLTITQVTDVRFFFHDVEAEVEMLRRRVTYGGRKGRRALRRLIALERAPW